MNRKDIYYFITIADEQNVSSAAKKLYVAQPSLSQFLKKLETTVGTPLFRRTTGGLILTFAGERFYAMAVKILKLYENFEFEVSDINHMKLGRINFGITRHLGSIVLPKILPRFRDLCPNIDLQISEQNTATLEKEVLAGRLDFAIMHAPADSGQNSSLNYEILNRDPFIIALPPNSPLAKQSLPAEKGELFPVLDLKELDGQPFLMIRRSQRIRQICDQLIKKAGISYQISYELSNIETVLRCVAEGMGAAILPCEYSKLPQLNPSPQYFSIPEKYQASWELCITTSKEFFQTKASELFIRLVRDFYKEG